MLCSIRLLIVVFHSDKDWGDKVKARLSDWNTTINKRIETATKQLQDKLVENYNFDKSKFTSDNK